MWRTDTDRDHSNASFWQLGAALLILSSVQWFFLVSQQLIDGTFHHMSMHLLASLLYDGALLELFVDCTCPPCTQELALHLQISKPTTMYNRTWPISSPNQQQCITMRRRAFSMGFISTYSMLAGKGTFESLGEAVTQLHRCALTCWCFRTRWALVTIGWRC